MTQQYFSQKFVNPLDKPMQEIMDLNMKTIQSFSYITPVELFNVLKPEEIVERNMNIFIQNSHKALDYVQNMFGIMEKNWISISEKISSNTKQALNQVNTTARHNMKEAMDVGQRTAKEVVKNVKKVARKSVKQADSLTRKNIKETAKTMKKATKSASSALKTAKKSVATKTAIKTAAKPVARTTTKAKPQKKVVAKTNSRKPEIKTSSSASAMIGKPNTINKIEDKIHETRQVSPVSVPTVGKDLNPNLKKDRPLM